MARYLSPRTLGSVFNNDQFFAANTSTTLSSISSSQLSTSTAKMSSLSIILGADSLTLQDSLFQQHGNDLNISTDDGYTLNLNNNKPTSGDININENSQNSNVNIVNGNLNIRNGYLNLGNGSILLDGADINAILVGNQYQLSVQADTLSNTEVKVQTQAVSIQESIDTGVVNTNQIVSIQSNYAPLDQPIFSTNMTMPPIVIANGAYLTDVQLSYLINVNGDVQTAINSLNTNVATVTRKEVQDASNISILQTNLAIVTSNQLTDEANISILQTNLATVTSKQFTDETNIASLQTNLATVTSKQLTDESAIASIQTSLAADEINIAALQSSLATVSSKQITDEASIIRLQSLVNTKANINSPTFTGIPQVPTATAISN